MLKMALFDCASNIKCCSTDGRWGICPLRSAPPLGITHPKPKKMLMPGDQLGEGGGGMDGRRWNWLVQYLSSCSTCKRILLGC